ncbi:hypothetical protein ACFLW2_03755 [Chloroflexota bacterium]
MSTDDIEKKKSEIKDTLCCPHCDTPLKKWDVPQSIFTQWPNEFFYICFNDDCSYFLRGWDAMARMGRTCSHRLMYDPLTDCCQPIPVNSRELLRDGIIE